MGMTLGVYTNDADHKYLGSIPLKFYGYTNIENLPSCNILAMLTDETPEYIDIAMCASNPRYTIDKSDAVGFLHIYVTDAMWYINTEDSLYYSTDEQKCKACLSVYTNYVTLAMRMAESECESFDFRWC